MIYHYLASNKAGKKIEGNFETDDIGRVLQYLASQELRPLTVTPIKTGSEADVRHFFGGINLSDKIFLTRYLSLMLRVGTDLISAVNILIADYEKLAMKTFLIELQANLAKGQPFYQPFSKYPRVFSPVFVNLVKAAEKSGRLQQTFEDLSVSLQKEADLRGKIRGALLYPVILLAVSFVVFSFLALFALPKIAKVFSDSGIEPPLFSRITFQVGLFLEIIFWQLYYSGQY
jgi:type II secretory pathway component PulF